MVSSVQVENGFSRIANALYDAIIAADFSRREQKIIHATIRLTYGWNRKRALITLDKYAQMTGLDRAHVQRTIRVLADRKVLLRERKQNGQEIAINKEFTEWELPKQRMPKQQQPNEQQDCSQNGGPTVAETANLHNRKTVKDKKTYSFEFERFYSAYPLHESKADAAKAFNALKPDETFLRTLLAALEKQKAAREEKENRGAWVPQLKLPATWLRKQCWLDEVPAPSTSRPRKLVT